MNGLTFKPSFSINQSVEAVFNDDGTSVSVPTEGAYPQKFVLDATTDDGLVAQVDVRHDPANGGIALHSATVGVTTRLGNADVHLRGGQGMDTRRVNLLNGEKPFQAHADADLRFRPTMAGLNPKHNGVTVEAATSLGGSNRGVLAVRVATPGPGVTQDGGSVAALVDGERFRTGVMALKNPMNGDTGAAMMVEDKQNKIKLTGAYNATQQQAVVTASHQRDVGEHAVIGQIQLKHSPSDTEASTGIVGLRKLTPNVTAFLSATATYTDIQPGSAAREGLAGQAMFGLKITG